MPRELHEKITALYNSGRGTLQFMKESPFASYRLFRDYVSEQSWDQQLRIGWAAIDHVLEHGNLDTFNPITLGLIP